MGLCVQGICFHPSQPVLAVGLVNGDADLYQYSEVRGGEEPEWIVKRSIHCTPHTESCRAVVFDEPGTSLFAASSDHSISAVGTATGKLKRVHKDAHPAAISRLTCIGPHVIASGDEDGGVKIWDWRQRRATAEFDVHKDYISDFAFHSPSNSLIAVSGDGSLSVIDARRGKLKARSEDDGDDELLSAEVMKAGSKIVVGTQAGVLSLFSWGHFKDCSDRFPGHPMSVSALVKYDEDTLLSASSDGMIRILNILPNKLLGVLGMHSDDPIECMAMAQDRSALATTSHDNRVMLWSLNMLQGVDDNEDDDKDDAGDVEGGGAAMGGRAAAEALEASEPQAREPSTTARPSTRAADHATDDCAPEGSEDDSDEEARPQKKGKNKRKRAKTRMKGRPAPANKKSSFFDGLL